MPNKIGYFLRTQASQGIRLLESFLWWSFPNVFLALLQVWLFFLMFWIAQTPIQSEKMLENSVLLFYATGLLGTTAYSLLRRPLELLSDRRLLFYGVFLMLLVLTITICLYIWGVLIQHDPKITFRPLWELRMKVEIAVTSVVILFAYFTSEG